MTRSRWQFGLPLLTKELIEQAGRRRTYLVRIAYALLLFVLAYLEIDKRLSRPGIEVLGSGKSVFDSIISLQTWGVYVFMPALACGAITQEKECNSLTMLLITRLSPTTILFEKLVSRLVPMLSFLLLSMPLLAFAYSLGGVTTQELWCSLAILTCLTIQVATFALMCSAFCSTTVSAFFSSYIFGLLLFGPLGCCSQPGLMMGGSQVADTIVYCMFATFTTTCFFVLARAFIVTRATVAPRNFMLETFRRLDGFFTGLNQVTTGGVILIRDSASLPGAEPIAWREVNKKSLGTARYLIRVFVVLEIPLLFILAITADRAFGTRFRVAAGVLSIVWVISTLLISVKSAALVTSERSRQTMDVLLASPMSGPSIMKQYFAGVRRLMMVLYVPFLTIFAFELWWGGFDSPGQALMYVVCSGLSILIYCPLIAWISFLIGLKVHSQSRAILLSLMLIFGWTFLPILLLPNVVLSGMVMVFTPAYAILANEDRSLRFGTLVVNFVVYGGMLFCLRRGCLALADSFLGRLGDWESLDDLAGQQ